MAADRQAEIAASVAALKDLGPGYDQALAEGLVERIGTEIDKRIAAEIDNRVTAEVDSRILTQLDRYAGCRHQRRRARRISRAERRMIRAERADRSGLQSIMLALGSMLVALPVTAIVLKRVPGRGRHHAHGPGLDHRRDHQCGLRHPQAPAAVAGRPLSSPLVEPGSPRPALVALIDRFQPEGTAEAADIQRVRALLEAAADPYRRDLPLHVTASALIVHPPTGRVLLRWHQRQQAWLQVGGHGDPGETDPLAIVAREAEEETGLTDLVPWPDAEIKQVVIVDVPPGKGEPAHQHADVRFFMATGTPDAIRAENAQAQLRWLTLPAARDTTSEPNLREALTRIEPLLKPRAT